MRRDITESDLEPDQVNLRNRMFMPCRGTTQWAWVRAGNVITLGELGHPGCERARWAWVRELGHPGC